MRCPICDGSRKIVAYFVLYADGSEKAVTMLPCEACRATGEVDDNFQHWHELGRELKARRRARNELLHEAAARLGIGVAEYSRMERGLSDPAPALEE